MELIEKGGKTYIVGTERELRDYANSKRDAFKINPLDVNMSLEMAIRKLRGEEE